MCKHYQLRLIARAARHLGHVVLFGLIIALTLGSARADSGRQSAASIRAAVHAYLVTQLRKDHDKFTVTVGDLDPRLQLPRCQTALSAFATGTQRLIGATTVGIRCNGAKPWTLYVSARTSVFEKVLVTAYSLRRNHVLTAADLRVERRDLATLPRAVLEQPKQAIGQVLRRSLDGGQTLSFDFLSPPRLVRRGQRVTLMAMAGGVEVRMGGKALNDGAKGDVIRVRNTSSKRIVQGTVVAAGRVQVR